MKKIIFALVLLNQTLMFAQNYKFGKVSKEEIQEEIYPLDSTANAAYLYKQRRSYFDFDQSTGWFKLITEIHQRIKIYKKEGFDYANHSIVYYNPDSGDRERIYSIKGYTYNLENGKVVKEKLSKNNIFKEKINKYNSKVKLTMPDVKEGSVLELRYQISSPYPTSIADVEFQKGIPIKKLESQIEIPEYYEFNKNSKGFLSLPMKVSIKNENVGSTRFNVEIIRFEGTNIEALKDNEPYVANINNYRGGVKFELAETNFIQIGGNFKKYSTTWGSVCKQIFESSSFGEELNKSSYYKKDLETILAVAKTPEQKIGAIFQFVKNKVKWNGFIGKYTDKGVRKAYKERLGNAADINLMLTAMLRSAGLNSNPVLVSSKGNGIPFFPTLDGFDYVISIVEFEEGGYVLLDATEPYSKPNLLPSRALNWNGRKVMQNGGSSWVKLTNSKHSTEENNLYVKLKEDLSIEGLCRTKLENHRALNFRKKYNHVKEESLITQYEEANGIEVDDFKILHKDEIYKPITRNVKFLSEDLVESINGKLYIEPLLFLTQHKNPFKLKERKFPVDFSTPWKVQSLVTMKIPEGYKIETIPEAFAIALPDKLGVFKYEVKQSGNKVSTVCILQFDSHVIAPKYYPYLKDFYSKLVKKESEKIVLVKM